MYGIIEALLMGLAELFPTAYIASIKQLKFRVYIYINLIVFTIIFSFIFLFNSIIIFSKLDLSNNDWLYLLY